MLIDNPTPWPDGARCAVAITFDFDADSLLHNARPNDAGNYVSVQSFLRYGDRVAVPRTVPFDDSPIAELARADGFLVVPSGEGGVP